MSAVGWAFLLSTLAFLAGLWLTWLIHSRVTMDIVVLPVAPPPAEHAPLISVIMPARNEARNIGRSVRALLAQTYPNLEVIVVDDRSTDATPDILEALAAEQAGKTGPGLHVIQGRDLPEGWAGKPHALVQGARAGRGEWFAFIDADTFARPELIASTYACAVEHQAGLFTILTDQELGSFWEKVILPLVFTALSFGFPAERVNDPHKPDAIANGQYILIRRAVYEATGGHASQAVRGRIDEDKAMAELIKGAGQRLLIADGRQVAVTRMYTSLDEMWEGWTKNIFLGLRDRLGLLLFGAFAGLLGALALPLWLVGGLAWWAVEGGIVPAVVALQAAGVWAYLLYWRVGAARAFGISPLYAVSLPLGALVFTAMMFASTYKVLSGQGVTWRGRTYQG